MSLWLISSIKYRILNVSVDLEVEFMKGWLVAERGVISCIGKQPHYSRFSEQVMLGGMNQFQINSLIGL